MTELNILRKEIAPIGGIYGVDKGSKILTKKKTNAAANPVPTQNTILSFSDDENSDDE